MIILFIHSIQKISEVANSQKNLAGFYKQRRQKGDVMYITYLFISIVAHYSQTFFYDSHSPHPHRLL